MFALIQVTPFCSRSLVIKLDFFVFLLIILLQVAMEAIQNIRTVAQLTKEAYFYNQYSQILDILYQYCCCYFKSTYQQSHLFFLQIINQTYSYFKHCIFNIKFRILLWSSSFHFSRYFSC